MILQIHFLKKIVLKIKNKFCSNKILLNYLINLKIFKDLKKSHKLMMKNKYHNSNFNKNKIPVKFQ